MPITPKLARQLRETLGEEAAEDLVNWMHDMDAQRAETRDAIRADLAELRQEMRAGFASLREESRADLAKTREQMVAGFARAAEERARLEARFERRFGDLLKWSFVFWVGAVGAIAMLAQVLP